MRWITVIVVSLCTAIGWFRGLVSDALRGVPKYTLSKTEALALLQAQYPGASLSLKDAEYTATDLEGTYQAIMLALSRATPWKKNIDDCENKAFRLWCNMTEIGISAVYYAEGYNSEGKRHGFNALIIRDGNTNVLHLLEPQSGLLDPANYKVVSISHPTRQLDYAESPTGVTDSVEIDG